MKSAAAGSGPVAKKRTLDAGAIFLLFILCGSWGLNQVAIKVTNQAVAPLLQSGLRSAGASLLILMWMLMRREPLWERDGTLWWGIAAGTLFAMEFLLVYWGLDFTLASRSSIFLYLSPFVVALGAQLFIPGENLSRIQVAGLCTAFLGIVLAFRESMGLPSMQMLIGDSMLVGAAVFWGATTVLIKASPLVKIRPGKVLLYQLVVSAVVLLAASWTRNEPGITTLTPLIVGSLLYQTVWVAFVTYLVWFWLIRTYPPSRLASFTFLTPLMGVLAGGLLLKDPISPVLIVALLLVCVGIYLVNR
ncbi:MAG: DMT family transporter [Deltaproteobacteria bacterium]|nr:DMT family transporter [Deltaproteobacteria bacterium]